MEPQARLTIGRQAFASKRRKAHLLRVGTEPADQASQAFEAGQTRRSSGAGGVSYRIARFRVLHNSLNFQYLMVL